MNQETQTATICLSVLEDPRDMVSMPSTIPEFSMYYSTPGLFQLPRKLFPGNNL